MGQNDEGTVARLRLAACLRKIDAFLRQIDDLLDADFPHADSKLALRAIRDHFMEWDRDIRSLKEDSSPDFINESFNKVTEKFETYTGILGFILRSTNVRNAFEFYFPLRRIVRKIIGDDANLLLSSEWDFTPFTWPMNLPELPNFVLVGLPAPESSNALLAPLAGHEIGHSAWTKKADREKINKALSTALESRYRVDARSARLSRLYGTPGWALRKDECLVYLRDKTQEAYCDLFGLYLFGAGFLYAFEYLLVPGVNAQRAAYPTDYLRVEILKDAAKKWEIAIEPDALAGWVKPDPPTLPEHIMMEIADMALSDAVPTLIEDVKRTCDEARIRTINPARVAQIKECFAKNVPYARAALISEIVLAGWQRMRERDGLRPDPVGVEDDMKTANREEYNMLQELMLKSIEVAEFRTLVAEHKRRERNAQH